MKIRPNPAEESEAESLTTQSLLSTFARRELSSKHKRRGSDAGSLQIWRKEPTIINNQCTKKEGRKRK